MALGGEDTGGGPAHPGQKGQTGKTAALEVPGFAALERGAAVADQCAKRAAVLRGKT